jgi:DNA-binding MarR family transcriptional regulator
VRNVELEPRQYQLMLALKALSRDVRPRIAELAEQLGIHHHSAVELVNACEEQGLLRRERGVSDRREVLVKITPAGEEMIRELVRLHLAEVFSLAPALLDSIEQILARKSTS